MAFFFLYYRFEKCIFEAKIPFGKCRNTSNIRLKKCVEIRIIRSISWHHSAADFIYVASLRKSKLVCSSLSFRNSRQYNQVSIALALKNGWKKCVIMAKSRWENDVNSIKSRWKNNK